MKRRIFYTSSLLLVCMLLVKAWDGSLTRQYSEYLYQRKIEVRGNRYLSWQDLDVLLPYEKSNLWWYLNLPEIKVGLLQHPLIESVNVERCSPSFDWACFSVEIHERVPRLRVLLEQQEWLADERGVLITVLPAKAQSDRFDGLPLVHGLLSSTLSTDEAQARLRFISSSLLQLQAETGRYVKSIEFLDRGELRVYFEGLNFPVRFGSPLVLQPGGLAPLSLVDQVSRMEQVLAKLPQERDVQELDLGFSTLAILR
jgi:cell division septal protein FtsQ